MSTLAEGGRINKNVAENEFARLVAGWRRPERNEYQDILEEVLGPKKVRKLDLFDKAQLAQVLKACKEAKNISEAGRRLFSESRKKKKTANDADRLRKYLKKFGLTWENVRRQG
jgi:transcriptional regulatory protein RtcR